MVALRGDVTKLEATVHESEAELARVREALDQCRAEVASQGAALQAQRASLESLLASKLQKDAVVDAALVLVAAWVSRAWVLRLDATLPASFRAARAAVRLAVFAAVTRFLRQYARAAGLLGPHALSEYAKLLWSVPPAPPLGEEGERAEWGQLSRSLSS